LNRHSSSPEERFALAERMQERGEYTEALKLWREMASELLDASILCRQASLAEQLGFIEEAEGAYRKAIRIDGGLPWAYVGLANILTGRREFADAATLLARALTLERSAIIYALLGAALIDLNRNEEAIESLQAAIFLDPTYEEAYLNLGSIKKNTDTKAAESLFLKALEIDPEYADAHRELGWLLNQAEPTAQAEYHLRRAIELKPDDSWSRVYLGNLLWKRGDTSAAISEFEGAIKLTPTWALPLWSLANVYESQELWKEAEALYERAIAVEPHDAIAHMNFGRMLRKKGDKTRASAELRMALSIDPNYEEARKLLAEGQLSSP
jgi:tetratricopeptide (TPR) repeat protein